jgi:curli biogenesis system outer membrane secretion channel CsgG
MKRVHITFTVGVLLCANLYAAESKDVVVREVIGKGSSRSQAIKDALYVAVSQVRGVEVGSGTYELGFSEAGIGVDSGQADKRRVEFDSLSVATSGTAYTTKIGGAVKGYEVLEEKELADGAYEVKLRVTVYDYAPRGDSQRPKIGVMPVGTPADSYSFFDVQTPSSVLSSLLSQRLAVGLTQTNKFAVLDRESIAEFAMEKRLLVSNDAPLEEKAKLAEMLGSDYLLTGAISQAKLEKKQKVLGAANYTVTEYKARVVFNYRLIVSFTRQVVVAGVVEKYLENEQIRALADEQNSAEWDAGQIRDAILAIVANEAVSEIIDRLYPMRVASVQENGVVVVNQGGDRISQGALLEVFTEGEEVFDPDTKESLGKVQNVVATIRVKRIAEKMSFADVVDGDLSKISKGLICRARKPKKEDDAGMKRSIIRNENGGVKLPFDR